MQIYKITNILNGKIYIGKDAYNRKNYFGSGLIIKSAIRKYGKQNFIKEILEECQDLKELSKREIYWIEKLNSRNSEIGYNIAIGGDNVMTGRTCTNEHKQKISMSLSGVKKTENAKISMSKARLNTRSKEFSILAIDKQTGEKNKFISQTVACKSLNLPVYTIKNNLCNKYIFLLFDDNDNFYKPTKFIQVFKNENLVFEAINRKEVEAFLKNQNVLPYIVKYLSSISLRRRKLDEWTIRFKTKNIKWNQ